MRTVLQWTVLRCTCAAQCSARASVQVISSLSFRLCCWERREDTFTSSASICLAGSDDSRTSSTSWTSTSCTPCDSLSFAMSHVGEKKIRCYHFWKLKKREQHVSVKRHIVITNILLLELNAMSRFVSACELTSRITLVPFGIRLDSHASLAHQVCDYHTGKGDASRKLDAQWHFQHLLR